MKQLIGLFLKITNKKHMKDVMPTDNYDGWCFFCHFHRLLHEFSVLM